MTYIEMYLESLEQTRLLKEKADKEIEEMQAQADVFKEQQEEIDRLRARVAELEKGKEE